MRYKGCILYGRALTHNRSNNTLRERRPNDIFPLTAPSFSVAQPYPWSLSDTTVIQLAPWYTPHVYLMFYADADLLAYLAGISSDPVILVVYSPAPIHFRRGEVVFVSTGLILESQSEGELFDAIARDGGCPLFPGRRSPL